ncbi:MAG: GreA/GreB family elongation factor, partial [Candidatus Omnitrophica bacterium]|nr:GreA/GreB family elongation factor [Candidatus Omnitrophota bacterium]
PVGKALLGHKIGDIVQITIPAGTLKYKIVNISR